MIFTDKAAREKIASLETRIGELEADAALKDSAIEAHTEEITAKDQTIAEHVASIGTLNESIADITGELTAAQSTITEKETKITELTAAVAEAKQSAGNIAIETLASIGQSEPLAIEGGSPEVKTITREQFNTLDHSARGKFMSSGGKIKD